MEEQQFRMAERLQRLNDLGFDVGEVELITSPEGARLRVHTRVAEPGQQRRELFRLTGLEVQERQARRLLNDIRAYRASLEQKSGGPVSESYAAHRWLGEVYQPVVDAIPPEPGRPARAGGGLPRGPGAPLVPVGAGQAGRRDGGGGDVVFRDGAAPDPKEVTTPSVIAGRRGRLSRRPAIAVSVRPLFRCPRRLELTALCDLHHSPCSDHRGRAHA